MTFYASGIRSKTELELITRAGADNRLPILVDVYDYPVVADYPGEIALDSGSYANMKQGRTVSVVDFAARLRDLPLRRFTFVTALDVFGDSAATFRNWITLRERHDLDLMPVWPFDGDPAHLTVYLRESQRVGIGGLVPLLRDRRPQEKAAKAAHRKERQRHLDRLLEQIRPHPGRFHAFGLCWSRAIEACAPYLASADSSKWLCGRRYREVVYRNTRHGHLMQSPCRFIPAYRELRDDGDALCVVSAANIDTFWQQSRSVPIR